MGNLLIKEELVSCCKCIVEIKRDKLLTFLDAEEGSHEVKSQPLYELISKNITLTPNNPSHVNNVCGNIIVIFDTSQHILKRRNEKRANACFCTNFKCESDDQHIMADLPVEANLLKLYLDQIYEEANSMRNTIEELWIDAAGGKLNFKILMRTRKGIRTYFEFGSSDHFARGSPATFTLHPILCTRIFTFSTGRPLYELAYRHGALQHVHRHFTQLYCTLGQAPLNAVTVFAEPPAFTSNSQFMFTRLHFLKLANYPYPQMPDDRISKSDWSWFPDHLLWMIMDKLDIFDNMRLAAVCRGWQSASASNPKVLQSVGDGLPWIWQESTDFKNSSRDFISVAREYKFSIDLAEFHEASVLFSKHGWILVRRRQNFSNPKERLSDSLFLINPFTRDKIKLPDVIDPSSGYAGSFSTREGYPNCVVLLKFCNPTQVTIRIAYPGNEVWTEHSYFGQRTVFAGYSNLITVGQNVYCYDTMGKMIIYNMASNLWRELSGSDNVFLKGYITEHEGAIVKIERDDYNFRSFKVFLYNDADTAWERLNDNAVRDTSWYLCNSRNCFSAKEKGLKVYSLCPRRGRVPHMSHDNVVLHDLITGSTQTLHLPYPVSRFACWVDIG